MVKDTLKIEGMSCGHCQAAVEGALKELAGMSEFQVHLESGQVEVTYDDTKLSIDQIKTAIEDQGYDVA